MKRAILAAVVAVALTSKVVATEYIDLTIRHAPPPRLLGVPARIINIPEPLGDAERRDRDLAVARWTKHCQPVKHVDAYGVTRLTYAHPGCAFGEGE